MNTSSKKRLLLGVLLSLSTSNAMESLKEKEKYKTYTAESLGLRMDETAFNEALQFQEDFMSAFKSYAENKEQTLAMSKGQDIIVTIGNTGAGKSTLLNLLKGHQLKAVRNQGYVLEKEDLSDSFKIGTGQASETLLPKVIITDNMVLSDLPGFADTRGKATALLNSVFIRDIIVNANTVRFLFVEGQDTITGGKGKEFKETLNVIKTLLPDVKQLTDSSLFIVTRSSSPGPKTLIKFLQDKIKGGEESAAILSTLEAIFTFKEPYRIWPFENADKFIKTDEETEDEFIDEEAVQKSLNTTKKNIEKAIGELKKVSIQQINPYALLAPRTDENTRRLLKVSAAIHFSSLFSQDNQLTKLNDNELDSLQEKIKKQKEPLKKEFLSKPEIEFFKFFSNDYNNVDMLLQEVDERAEKLVTTIDALKDERRRQKYLAELEIRKKFKSSDEYQKMYKDIASSFSDMESKSKAYYSYDATFSGWDIFALGITYLVRQDKNDDLRKAYNDSKDHLKEKLKKYLEHPLIQEKHPRHDEVN